MLSIIIVNYKNAPLLRLCLQSLHRSIANNFQHEIIVVDSASEPSTANVATDEFSNIVFLPFRDNIGYTKGANQGIKKAKGDFIFIINPDIVPLEGSIEKLYGYMKDTPNVGMAGPQLLNFDGSPQQSCFRFYTPLTIVGRRTFLGKLPFFKGILSRFSMKDKDLKITQRVDWLMGSAIMVSKKAIEKAGLMDEQYYLYMSDVDWPRRFWENGYQVMFFPASVMYHYHRRESRSALNALDAIFNRQARQHIKDAFRYFRKNGIREASNI